MLTWTLYFKVKGQLYYHYTIYDYTMQCSCSPFYIVFILHCLKRMKCFRYLVLCMSNIRVKIIISGNFCLAVNV